MYETAETTELSTFAAKAARGINAARGNEDVSHFLRMREVTFSCKSVGEVWLIYSDYLARKAHFKCATWLQRMTQLLRIIPAILARILHFCGNTTSSF